MVVTHLSLPNFTLFLQELRGKALTVLHKVLTAGVDTAVFVLTLHIFIK